MEFEIVWDKTRIYRFVVQPAAIRWICLSMVMLSAPELIAHAPALIQMMK